MIWKNLRVETDTMTLLARYRARLEAAILRRPDIYPAYMHDTRLSLSQAVQWLLKQQLDHGERSRRHRKKKRDLPGQQLIEFPESERDGHEEPSPYGTPTTA